MQMQLSYPSSPNLVYIRLYKSDLLQDIKKKKKFEGLEIS